MNSTELREQRAALVAQAEQLLTTADSENRSLTPEEEEKWSKMSSDIDKMKADIDAQENREKADADRRQRIEALTAEMRASQGRKAPAVKPQKSEVSDADRKEAIRAWALAGTEFARTDADTVSRAAACGVNVNSRTLDVRALSKGTTTAGGHTVPTTLSAEIDKALKYYGNVRGLARVIQTAGPVQPGL